MRLWHQSLISNLPNKQLLGQHREICGLRGLGFGKKHKVVDYVFNYPYAYLYNFHILVINEMEKRGFKVDNKWKNIKYRGKQIGYDNSNFTNKSLSNLIIYREHNREYLEECLLNLKNKGIVINISKNDNLYKLIKQFNLLHCINY